MSKKLIKGIYTRNLNEYQYLMKNQDIKKVTQEQQLTDPEYYDKAHPPINDAQNSESHKPSQIRSLLARHATKKLEQF